MSKRKERPKTRAEYYYVAHNGFEYRRELEGHYNPDGKGGQWWCRPFWTEPDYSYAHFGIVRWRVISHEGLRVKLDELITQGKAKLVEVWE